MEILGDPRTPPLFGGGHGGGATVAHGAPVLTLGTKLPVLPLCCERAPLPGAPGTLGGPCREPRESERCL